jgi:Uma2 family endonuclease
MASTKPRALLEIAYEEAAQAYLRSLPLEHFMEATPQGTQREITLESLAVVKVRLPDLHIFNELLVQYPRGKDGKIQQVVPDNMVLRSEQPIEAVGSFNLPLQPVGPFWVMEYVSKHSKRKDYEDNFDKYERELKVPYYLLFYPDNQELTLYHHTGRKYVSVKPNEHGRYGIPELELEVALLDGWVRYWFRGKLVPLPADLVRNLEAVERQLKKETRRANTMERRAKEDADRAKAMERRAEEEAQRAEEQARRADEEARRADAARRGQLAAEEQLARVRAELEQLRARQKEGSQ